VLRPRCTVNAQYVYFIGDKEVSICIPHECAGLDEKPSYGDDILDARYGIDAQDTGAARYVHIEVCDVDEVGLRHDRCEKHPD
jgi:hypothetical protein